jgi:tellurite resistance protein
VLEHEPGTARAAAEAEFHAVMRFVLLQIAIADGEVTDDELVAIRQICHDIAGKDLPEGTLEAELVQIRRGTIDFEARLGQCAGYLNEHGKELVVRAALQVAAADGHVDTEELEQIAAIAKALQMSPSHVNGVFADALGDSGPRSQEPSRN